MATIQLGGVDATALAPLAVSGLSSSTSISTISAKTTNVQISAVGLSDSTPMSTISTKTANVQQQYGPITGSGTTTPVSRESWE